MNVQHSNKTDKWNTPENVLTRVRTVLGNIYLDPASDHFGNTRVKADGYYTAEMDALSMEWANVKTIFLNPPGGKIGNKSKAALFWRKLVQHVEAGKVGHAIFMAFSLEQLQTTQDGEGRSIGDFPFCVPRRRLRFVDAYGNPGDAPSHSNMVVYLPGTINRLDLFESTFNDMGVIVGGKR